MFYILLCASCELFRYSLMDGASFEQQTRNQIFSLSGDDGKSVHSRPHSQMKWDRKKKKFVKGNGEGADNVKMVKTEGGTRLPVSYKSGRFQEWQSKNHVSLPRVGEQELPRAKNTRPIGRSFKHKSSTAPKALDKNSLNYDRKIRQLKKKHEKGIPSEAPAPRGKGKKSRFAIKTVGRVKSELKTADQIRKSRELAAKRKAKNARSGGKKNRR
jgi:ATP-dependent RNA helicase DDX54/DBP10